MGGSGGSSAAIAATARSPPRNRAPRPHPGAALRGQALRQAKHQLYQIRLNDNYWGGAGCALDLSSLGVIDAFPPLKALVVPLFPLGHALPLDAATQTTGVLSMY